MATLEQFGWLHDLVGVASLFSQIQVVRYGAHSRWKRKTLHLPLRTTKRFKSILYIGPGADRCRLDARVPLCPVTCERVDHIEGFIRRSQIEVVVVGS